MWFGCTGDLGLRMTFPALFALERAGRLQVPIVGVAHSEWSIDDLRERARESIDRYSIGTDATSDVEAFDRFVDRLHYVDGDYNDASTFAALRRELDRVGSTAPISYLAIPPDLFGAVIRRLGEHGLAGNGRVIVEKPFGRDLESSRRLDQTLLAHFAEDQVFRIDHYLGKEEVMGILFTRFANVLFEPLWNRTSIDSVHLTMAEDFGVEGRGRFYDGVGALRDVVQNHLLQLVSLLAMEPPADMQPGSVHREQEKVLHAIDPIPKSHCVRGQFEGYLDEPGVAAGSDTETFVAVRFEIDTWRWAGVPWLVRAGKHLPVHATEAIIRFRQPPTRLFGEGDLDDREADYFRVRVTPSGQMAIGIHAKEPGHRFAGPLRELALRDEQVAETAPYERLLGDALAGDATLFTTSSGVEAAWRVVDGLVHDPPVVQPYQPGTWGPPVDKLAGTDAPWYCPASD